MGTVLETVEALFSGLPNEFILRAELWWLFSCIKSNGLTALVTGEKGENTLKWYGLEKYMADFSYY